MPHPQRAFDERALDIILVNSRSARKPSEAQALAQANLDGGGNTEKPRRAKTPLPPAPKQQEGDELHQAQRKVQELEAHQQRLVTRAPSQTAVAPATDREVQPEPLASLSGRDLAQSALAMARIEGEIARELDDYNRRPRKKFIGVRAEEYRFAQYIEDWRQKIERVGTLNYPAAARGKLYGSLVLTVTLRRDGTVASVEINRSSGHKILDDAARRIVAMAAPFAAFPPAIQDDTDVLVITRSWNFTQRDSLETKAR
jgi:protein TonB